MPPTTSNGARRRRWATTVLGVVLLAEGLGKLAAPSGYFDTLAQFRALPQAMVAVAGALWMALELTSGLGLIVAGLSKTPSRALGISAAAVALGLQLAYATLSTQAYVRGLPIANCTCFGIYLKQHLSWFVLAQDAYMIGFASWQLVKISRWHVRA